MNNGTEWSIKYTCSLYNFQKNKIVVRENFIYLSEKKKIDKNTKNRHFLLISG